MRILSPFIAVLALIAVGLVAAQVPGETMR